MSFIITRFTLPLQQAIHDTLAVQKELSIAADFKRDGKREAPRGVLISSFSAKQIEEDMVNGANLWLARNHQNTDCVGYLFATTGKQFIEQHKQTEIRWDKGDFIDGYRSIIEKGGFSYLSQIGVRFAYQATGMSGMLIAAFERDYANSLAVCAVMRAPIDNIRSVRFFNRNGYRKLGRLYTPEYKGINDLESDFLVKDLS